MAPTLKLVLSLLLAQTALSFGASDESFVSIKSIFNIRFECLEFMMASILGFPLLHH